MSRERDIRESLRRICKGGKTLFLAQVVKVDKAKGVCDAVRLEDGKEYKAVSLNVLQNAEQGLFIEPKAESIIVVQELDSVRSFACQFSEIDGITIHTDKNIDITAKENITLNGGENGGLLKIEKVLEYLNDIYSDLQDLKTKLASHAVAGNGAPLALTFAPKTKKPQRSDMEDEKVKH